MVVKPAIDRVLDEIDDAGELLRYAGNSYNPPEARLLAGAKLLALFELSAEARWTRPPGLTRETVTATIAGLNSVRWRDPWRYCSLLDVRHPPGGREPPRREVPLA